MTTTRFFLTDPAERHVMRRRCRATAMSSAIRSMSRAGNPAAAAWSRPSPISARYGQMLLNGGTLDGRTYLAPKTFAAMTSDHIGPGTGVARNIYYYPGDGFGYGYGFGIRSNPGVKHADAARFARRDQMGFSQRCLYRGRPRRGPVFRGDAELALGADSCHHGGQEDHL